MGSLSLKKKNTPVKTYFIMVLLIKKSLDYKCVSKKKVKTLEVHLVD